MLQEVSGQRQQREFQLGFDVLFEKNGDIA